MNEGLAMKEKIMSLGQAASLVQDGNLLAMTMAVMENAPMAFLRELVRKGLRRLRLATLPGGGLNVDFLIGAGVVAEYETCYCFLGAFGPAPNFQWALRNQTIKMLDNT